MFIIFKTIFLIAQPLSQSEINNLATKFYQKILKSSQEKVTFTYDYIYFQQIPLLILIKYFDNNWLLISNDKKAPAVLAFSSERSYHSSLILPHLSTCLKHIAMKYGNILITKLLR